MQSVSSRIWTRIAVFISYGDNDYTTSTSKLVGKVVGLQIKCLLELNCVCPVPFNSARAFVALGSRWWKVPNTYTVKYLMLTVVGVEPKERESPVGLFFIMDSTWPQGAAADRWNRITSSLPKFLHIVLYNFFFIIDFYVTIFYLLITLFWEYLASSMRGRLWGKTSLLKLLKTKMTSKMATTN